MAAIRHWRRGLRRGAGRPRHQAGARFLQAQGQHWPIALSRATAIGLPPCLDGSPIHLLPYFAARFPGQCCALPSGGMGQMVMCSILCDCGGRQGTCEISELRWRRWRWWWYGDSLHKAKRAVGPRQGTSASPRAGTARSSPIPSQISASRIMISIRSLVPCAPCGQSGREANDLLRALVKPAHKRFRSDKGCLDQSSQVRRMWPTLQKFRMRYHTAHWADDDETLGDVPRHIRSRLGLPNEMAHGYFLAHGARMMIGPMMRELVIQRNRCGVPRRCKFKDMEKCSVVRVGSRGVVWVRKET